MKKLALAVAALLLVSGCGQSGEGNQLLAEANASGNAAAAAVQNNVRKSGAAPLQKDQALALMKQRHENYEQIGKANRAAKKALETGDIAAVRTAAATIAELAPKAQSWFPAGTGPEVGKTDAKAEIWRQPEQFAIGMQDFRDAAAAFERAAQGDDIEAMKAAQANLGKTCKSCHERFREDH